VEELIGKKIENYRIISILGKGGMGVVFKAKDEKLDRFVAIKFLAFEMIDKPKLAERFKREARNHAQLLHPNIVTVYGFIEYKQLLGIVMEYVEGESLEKVIFKNMRLHIYDVVYVMRQVLLGIGYAHSKGFIHRDIKPSNIIINSEGTVKIMDFGISKSVFDRDMTVTGSKLGTVFYMSPEQIKGDNVNYLSDIYSLGCTMFEMITGQPPFYSDTEYDVMDGHLKSEPPKVSSFVPGIPDLLEKIIEKCLQKSAEMRYKSCGDIIDELHQLDEYLKTVQSKYFMRKKKNPKFVKIKSIIFLMFMIFGFLGLFYFAYSQVDEFLKQRLYEKMEKVQLWGKNETGKRISVDEIKSGVNLNINAGIFKDKMNGVFVGDSSLILVTKDSCNSFQKIECNKRNDFIGIEYFKNSYLILSKKGGLMKYSEDFSNSVFVTLSENSVFFKIKKIFDKIFVLANNGQIFLTEDGDNWTSIRMSQNKTLFDIDNFNNSGAIIVGWDGAMFLTLDGGNTWSTLSKFTEKYLKGVSLYEDGSGIAVGAGGAIFRTNDFGENWVDIKNSFKQGFTSVKFINKEIVVITGKRGTILYSDNAGFDYQEIKINKIENINSLVLNNFNRKIYITADNGLLLKLKE